MPVVCALEISAADTPGEFSGAAALFDGALAVLAGAAAGAAAVEEVSASFAFFLRDFVVLALSFSCVACPDTRLAEVKDRITAKANNVDLNFIWNSLLEI